MFHPSFYPQAPPPSASTFNPMQFFNPSQTFFYRQPGPATAATAGVSFNRSTHNLNFTGDFERFQMPAHGFTSIPAGGGTPFRMFDFNKQQQMPPTDPQRQHQRWRQNMARMQQQQQQQQQKQQKPRQTPAFHFQDQSTLYFMTEPIRTSDDRIAIQLTKVHIGPNGDQQRVFVEQEFSNEQEFNAFVRNFRQNFEKAFRHRSKHGQNHHQTDPNDENTTDAKKPGVVVVEEPDEEPKIYQQQAYNAKIESKKAAAAAAASAAAAAAAAAAATIITPPATPTSCPSPSRSSSKPPPQVDPVPPTTQARTRPAHQRYVSPAAGHRMSSSSTNRSYRRRKRNKMKYRRQQAEQQKEGPSNGFQMPKYPPRYPLTPPPSKHFQQSFFSHDVEMNPPGTTGTPFQWRFNRPVPRTPRPPSTPLLRFHPPQAQEGRPRPATVVEHLRYPNHEQQQPRVHRTKSEIHQSRNFQGQRTRSAINQFAPIPQAPIIQRHFVPFCSAPNIFANQRRQFAANGQVHLGLFNAYRLGSTRF